MIFQQKSTQWQRIIRYAKLDAQEWKEAEKMQDESLMYKKHPASQNKHRWKRPPEGWMKCNVDGSFLNENMISKAGWIVRDDTGSYRGAVQAEGKIVHTSLESELQAILMALQFCWIKGYRRIIIEGDNQKAMQLLNYQ